MKYITTIIKKIMYKDSPKILGRWNIDYCNKKVNHKVDLSNEDHCGPCGQYALTKLEPKNENNIENTIKDTIKDIMKDTYKK